ncbi:hypothetical protein [Halorussus litoreus]|uniref:hypothetical protein n=1 Tax=Halorussus litoreus TaxID=1710536 RepID=UPI000E25A65B|nr:hypothetical protein [Halorussus litoreus]
MDAGTGFAVALMGATGLACVVVAALSLRADSRFRESYGVDAADDAAVRSNAAVLGVCGAGLLALAAAIALDVSGRVLGTATVVLAAGACVALGWLVRYRDRRDLLTTPGVDRETGARLGAAAMLSGLLVAPLAPAIWVGASGTVVTGLALGGTAGGLLAVAVAYR